MAEKVEQLSLFRVGILFASIVSIFVMLGLRLFHLQVVAGEVFRLESEANRLHLRPIPAPRGSILDRYNEPLVWNVQKYAYVNHPDLLYDVARPLDREEALKLLVSTQSAHVVTQSERLYRYPQALAHVLGYVGDVTAEDLQRDPELKVGQKIGKAGLEFKYEDWLRGQDGEEILEINALGLKQRQVQRHEPAAGQDLSTSLDPYLSQVTAAALGQQKGAVIITDTQTGQILALSSWPVYDPNILTQSIADPEKEKDRKKQISQFFLDENQLFFDRAISGAYPPGSIFKLVTSLAGLAEGKIDANTQVVDTGVLRVGEFEFGNWYYRQFGQVEGSIGLVRALARSNDIYFYKVAEWVGPDQLAHMSRQFGLGEKTGIDLPAEARGVVPDPEWKLSTKGERWFLGNTYHYGIGQGDILTSPIQLAQVTQAVANNGMLCQLGIKNDPQRSCRQLPVSSEQLELVLDGMVQACSASGTAFPFFPYNANHLQEGQKGTAALQNGAVGCKTGTAEFGGADERGYRKTHGWFTMIVDTKEIKDKATQASSSVDEAEASASARITSLQSGERLVKSLPTIDEIRKDKNWHDQWLSKLQNNSFPNRISITVLVESNEQNLFREGSRDAAPVAKTIVDWMLGVEPK